MNVNKIKQMTTERVRQLAVETVVNSTYSIETKFITMVYAVGGIRRIPLNGKDEMRTISDIVESKKYYTLYIAEGASTQKWKKIPISKRVIVDYFID